MSKIDYIKNNVKFTDKDKESKFQFMLEILSREKPIWFVEERYTINFLITLFEYGFLQENLPQIIEEIKILEDDSGESHLKNETQFGKLPLQGLWHKHYQKTGISSLAQNLINQHQGIEKMAKRASQIFQNSTKSSGSIKREEAWNIANKISKSLVSDSYEKRKNDRKLTGEWIVYHKYQGKNYYVAISDHATSRAEDEELASKIKFNIQNEFPEFENSLPIFTYE